MAARILLAGASGTVGFELLKLLKTHGYWVRTLSHSPVRAEQLKPLADEVECADAAKPDALADVCRNIEVVISCLGASVNMNSRDRRSFHAVDFVSNMNLLAEGQRSQISRFVYLSAFTTPDYEHTAYIQAHEAFVQRLRQSGLGHSVVRPTGIYSVFADFVRMAKKGFLPLIGNGQARTNPVHPIDVAQVLAESVLTGPQDIPIGGPEILSRCDIAAAAFQAIGKKPRFVKMPPEIFSWSAKLLHWWNPRLSELIAFGKEVWLFMIAWRRRWANCDWRSISGRLLLDSFMVHVQRGHHVQPHQDLA